MDLRRIGEMIGAFVLGGGVVAVGYELARAPDDGSAPRAEGRASAGGFLDWAAGEESAAADDTDAAAADGSTGEEPETGNEPPPAEGPFAPDENGSYTAFPGIYADEAVLDEAAAAKYPKHGLITAGAVTVRERADLESRRLGLLRAGTRVRVHAERTFGGGCSSGWRGIYPEGWICVSAGLDVGDTPPDDGSVVVDDPSITDPMPYEYLRVSHDATPMFHRLPSYREQDRADAAGQAWLAAKGREPMPTHPDKRPDDVPAVVKEYLNAGYYVTAASEHVHSKRHFVRTNRGVYARKYQLEQREGSDFRGVLLESADALPVHWIVREMTLQRRKDPESTILEPSDVTPPRRARHPFVRKIRIGDYDYYEDTDGLLMRAYAVGQSYLLKRPPGIGAQERWVHVDLSEQTLVAYIGSRPVFTTIVSTGREPGMTPTGVFRVQSKFVATSMRDQPIEDEAYSIEDVPWTQYFSNNVALHGAFWHGGFGLVRSHGCVNLSPADARWLFGFMSPLLPHDWHAVMPGVGSNGQGSAVVVTD